MRRAKSSRRGHGSHLVALLHELHRLCPSLDDLIWGEVDLSGVELLATVGGRQRPRVLAGAFCVRQRALRPRLATLEHLVPEARVGRHDTLLLRLLLQPLLVGRHVVAGLLLALLLLGGVGHVDECQQQQMDEEGAQQRGHISLARLVGRSAMDTLYLRLTSSGVYLVGPWVCVLMIWFLLISVCWDPSWDRGCVLMIWVYLVLPGGTEYKIMIYYSGGGHDLEFGTVI